MSEPSPEQRATACEAVHPGRTHDATYLNVAVCPRVARMLARVEAEIRAACVPGTKAKKEKP